MIGLAAFTYTMLASFVLTSADRNRRAQRPNHNLLEAVGWGLAALSIALAVLMGGRLLLLLIRG